MKKVKNVNLANIVIILFASYLFMYLYRAIGVMPLMDYWIDREMYIESAMNGGIPWYEIIKVPHGIHANPLFVWYDNFMIKYFGCDNRAYIYIGFLFSCLSLYILKSYYFKVIENNNYSKILGVALFLLPIINLNQWEIFTLYCNLPFMLRIFLYFVLLIWLEHLLKEHTKNQKINIVFFIFLNCFTILFASQAYMWGVICAEIAICVFDYVYKQNKEKIKYYILMIMPGVISGIIFMATAESQESVVMNYAGGMDRIWDFIKGIFFMLSATIIHQSILTVNVDMFLILGAIIFVLAIIAVVFYIQYRLYEKTRLPIALLVYAFVSICSIIYARIDSFGLVSLSSSRYVVETTLGLMGMIWIYWMTFKEGYLNKFFCSVVIIGIVVGILYSNNIEWSIAPARKMYNDKMVEIAKNIENYGDDEIEIFQSSAHNVKSGLNAMKKYELNIFGDEENISHKVYEPVGCSEDEYLYGWNEDGWVNKNSAFKIQTFDASRISIKYMSQIEQELSIFINGMQLESTIMLHEGSGSFEIPCNPNEIVVIGIKSNKEQQLNAPDERVCSYLVTEIERVCE